MSEPVMDLSEIVGMYKEDARRSVQGMRAALAQWTELIAGGAPCLEVRKLAHQLRGSGRTYGFRNVTRHGKALEHLMVKLQAKKLEAGERLQKAVTKHVDCLEQTFKE